MVRRAMQVLVADVSAVVSVEEWAVHTGVSRRVLERRFKNALGRTPHTMMLHERVEQAKILLTGTDLSVAVIAERCGFRGNERLTVNFRAIVGVPPIQYRRVSRGRSG